MGHSVGKVEFAEMVESVLADLPPQFTGVLDEVAIEIVDRPSAAQVEKLALGPNNLLLGLYTGRPKTRRSVFDEGTLPDVIYIFQENVQHVSRNRAELGEQVRITLLHEIGHHFGLNEKDLEELGY